MRRRARDGLDPAAELRQPLPRAVLAAVKRLADLPLVDRALLRREAEKRIAEWEKRKDAAPEDKP